MVRFILSALWQCKIKNKKLIFFFLSSLGPRAGPSFACEGLGSAGHLSALVHSGPPAYIEGRGRTTSGPAL